MDEFDFIARYFRPLAKDFPGALNLSDDAAHLHIPAGQQLLVTTDAMIAGVHFLGSEDPALLAQKLLRVNLSDLAAKGAEPYCYFLTLALPKQTDAAWIARFAGGLGTDQQEFGIHLAGGDTTATPGPLTLSVTALGLAPEGQNLTRAGAKPGNIVCISGTLGDAALGLRCLKGELPRSEYLEEHYLLPKPRFSLGLSLRGVASACMDISDGLVQDLGHICAASGVGAEIHAEKIPLSAAAQAQAGALEAALSGGDDYELLFTLPEGAALPADCAAIGVITAGKDVRVLDAQGKDITPARKGYKHFSD